MIDGDTYFLNTYMYSSTILQGHQHPSSLPLYHNCIRQAQIESERSMADVPNKLVTKSSTPPPRALILLARAHILLHTRADIKTETEFGAIAACGVMIYGLIMWQLAQHNARLMLVDEEEGLVLVDYTGGRGEIGEREIECRDVEGADTGKTGKEVGGRDQDVSGKSRGEAQELGQRDWEACCFYYSRSHSVGARIVGLRPELSLLRTVVRRFGGRRNGHPLLRGRIAPNSMRREHSEVRSQVPDNPHPYLPSQPETKAQYNPAH